MISKKEIAQQYGVSDSTMQKILNVELLEELEKVGYQKKQRLLAPSVVRKIYELIGKPLNEDE